MPTIAEHHPVLDDRQVADLPLAHQLRGGEHVVVGRDGDERARHHVPDLQLGERRAVAGEPQHVALGEDADEVVPSQTATEPTFSSSMRAIATATRLVGPHASPPAGSSRRRSAHSALLLVAVATESKRTGRDRCYASPRPVALGGELAVPCTRNPL